MTQRPSHALMRRSLLSVELPPPMPVAVHSSQERKRLLSWPSNTHRLKGHSDSSNTRPHHHRCPDARGVGPLLPAGRPGTDSLMGRTLEPTYPHQFTDPSPRRSWTSQVIRTRVILCTNGSASRCQASTVTPRSPLVSYQHLGLAVPRGLVRTRRHLAGDRERKQCPGALPRLPRCPLAVRRRSRDPPRHLLRLLAALVADHFQRRHNRPQQAAGTQSLAGFPPPTALKTGDGRHESGQHRGLPSRYPRICPPRAWQLPAEFDDCHRKGHYNGNGLAQTP